MDRSETTKNAILKLYGAAYRKPGSPYFDMSMEAIQLRLAYFYGVIISIVQLERCLSQYEKEGLIGQP